MNANNLLCNKSLMDIETPNYRMHVVNENRVPTCTLRLTYSFGASIEGKSERKSAQELRSRM